MAWRRLHLCNQFRLKWSHPTRLPAQRIRPAVQSQSGRFELLPLRCSLARWADHQEQTLVSRYVRGPLRTDRQIAGSTGQLSEGTAVELLLLASAQAQLGTGFKTTPNHLVHRGSELSQQHRHLE